MRRRASGVMRSEATRGLSRRKKQLRNAYTQPLVRRRRVKYILTIE